MKYKCLTIAGFDGSGGAGIQADLKTFAALGCYGMSVLTALPVQNTCGVKSCYEIPLPCIQEQLETVFEDIRPDSIKIGMLFSEPIIHVVTGFLREHASGIPIVLDPVMNAKSGCSLLLPQAIDALKNKLIPLSTIITPNIPEAQSLVEKNADLEYLGKELLKLNSAAVLLKGGHSEHGANDLFQDTSGYQEWLWGDRIHSNNTHGTGCTLSSAICAFLAKGYSLIDACKAGKTYLSGALYKGSKYTLGKGHGPVHHFYQFWP